MDDTQRFDPTRYRHWINEHVRFSDLDPLGHVNNNAMGEYFENARAALFTIITPRWPWRNQIFVLARSSFDFRHELHLPATFKIGTSVTELGTTSLKLASAILYENTGIAYCETVSVLIDQSTRRPTPLPDDLRQILQGFREGNL